MMGKVAGGDEQTVNALRLRGISSKGVYTALTGERLFMGKCPAHILVRSIMLAALIAWPAAPASAQTRSTRRNVAAARIVVAMDTKVRSHVYDQTANNKRTNADEVISSLRPVRGLRLIKEETSSGWEREAQVRAMNPDLIIIHLSAFAPRVRTAESADEEERKFISVLRSLADTNAQILMYSRRSTLDDEQGRRDWVSSMERRVPELRGRIQVFAVAGRQPQDFRNPQVQRALQTQVRSMLGVR